MGMLGILLALGLLIWLAFSWLEHAAAGAGRGPASGGRRR
jgi:hypothetical protein